MNKYEKKDEWVNKLRTIFEKNKNRVYMINSSNGKEYTFGEIEEFSLKFSSLLSSHGIKKQDKVAILLPNCVEFVLAYFSCMQLGAIPVPINTKLVQKDIQYILSNSEAKLILKDKSASELLTNIPILYLIINHTLPENNPEKSSSFLIELQKLEKFSNTSFNNVYDDDSIVIIYTSGTTNLPKGVEFSYENMISNALTFIDMVKLESNHRFYEILSLAYMAGFYNLMLVPFLGGASMVIDKAFDFSIALNFWKKIMKYNINALWLVPSIASMLLSLEYPEDEITFSKSGKVNLIFCGTAPLSESLAQKFEDQFSLKLHNTYGLSELLFISANYPGIVIPKGVGKILPGCKISILDSDSNCLPFGKEGEIAIESEYVMKGYHHFNENKTDQSFDLNLFLTGDIGYINEGFLYITDRKKDIIIRGGINISPAEIEEVIRKHPLVEEVAVVGIPDELKGEQIIAVIDSSSSLLETEVLNHCRNFLAPFKVPEAVVFMSPFPRSVTGKIQKGKKKKLILGEKAF